MFAIILQIRLQATPIAYGTLLTLDLSSSAVLSMSALGGIEVFVALVIISIVMASGIREHA